jgi:hypothetical protein
VKSLYDRAEHADQDAWLTAKYGNDIPDSQRNVVRLALTGHIRDSYSFFARNYVYIRDKSGATTLLRPFVGQAIHRVALDSQLRAGLPGRLVEVKARQLGWTTECLARAIHFILDENKRAFILVDDEDVAAAQATDFNVMLNGLPKWMQPMRRIQSMKHLVFENPDPKDRIGNPGLNSASQITVPSSFRGVGGAIFVSIGEYAHMDETRQEAVQMGLISSMGNNPHAILIIDTTPNGPGDSYHRMVLKAVEQNPRWTKRIENHFGEVSADEVFDGIFGVPDCVEKGRPGAMVPAICPWRFHEEYTVRDRAHPRGQIARFTKALRSEVASTLGNLAKYGGEEELEQRDRYGVSLERAFWRRCQIDNYEFPSDEMCLLAFRQEFLSTIESAFVDSGTTPFPRDSMDALQRMVREPKAVGLFRAEGEFEHWLSHGEPITAVHRDPNPWQEIRIFTGPQNDEKYTMGIDTDVAYESDESDYTVAQVVRASDNALVATYTAKVGSHELIKQLYCLYKLYGNAYYAIETAGMGYDLVRRTIDVGMGNCHYYKRLDADNPEPTKFPGWETAKPFMRAIMDQLMLEYVCHRNPQSGKAEPLCIIPDAKTVAEIRGLIRKPSGAFKSKNGHDDHVDAIEIAWAIAKDPYAGLLYKREEKPPINPYESGFKWSTGSSNRNHPSLSSI